MQGKTVLWFALFGVVVLVAPSARAAESYDLRPHLQRGGFSTVEVVLEVAGELKVPGENSSTQLPMQVKAIARYEDGIVAGSSTPTASRRFARKYDELSAKLQVDGRRIEPSLAADHRYVVADWTGEELQVFLPIGNFTRDELDLVSMPADSAVIDMLLPDQPVAVGDRWQFMPAIIAGLFGLDAVNTNDVEAELCEVQGSSAKCEVMGKVSGSVAGVGTELEIKAKYTFDLASKRITWLAMLIKEQRAIGHAAPGVEATSRLQVRISPIARPQSLPANLSSMGVEPTAANLALRYKAPNGAFEFDYDRRWQILSDDDKGATLRFIDQGELVAQLNILPLKASSTGQPVPLSTFQEDIQAALGTNFGQFVSAGQNADHPGRLIYRVVCVGKANDLPMQWNYHLVSSQSGEQVLLIATIEAELVERLADQDRWIVDRVRLAGAPQAASRPVQRR